MAPFSGSELPARSTGPKTETVLVGRWDSCTVEADEEIDPTSFPTVIRGPLPTNAPTSVKAVAFDVDQTLWDFHSHRRKALEQCLALIVERSTAAQTTAWTIDDLQARYDRIEANAPGERLSTIRGESLAEAAIEAAPADRALGDELTELYFSIRHGPAEPFPDVASALMQLTDMGLRLAVVTNGNTDMAMLGLAHHFEILVVGPDIGMAKPEERIYTEVANRLGCSPNELVCVGDDPIKDVAAPQALGWKGVWNDRGFATLPPHVKPDATVRSLSELPRTVERWM